MIQGHGIVWVQRQNFFKLRQGFGIISFVFQCHAQIQPGFGQIGHDSHGFAKLPCRLGGLAVVIEFQRVLERRAGRLGRLGAAIVVVAIAAGRLQPALAGQLAAGGPCA